ncbi:MAG: Hpt domain-containing protein [Clostridiales bacterium]|nr:Hpt domain-containing protein [Clostridiales bacterium]
MHKDVIDTQKGIACLAGKRESYIRIAGMFTKNIDAKVEALRGFFEKGDFKRLNNEFHGLKSSSASVGSTALPKIALELEMAGREGNDELIKEKFEAFIDQYRDTCEALDEAVSQL